MTNDYGLRHPGRREAAVAVLVALLLILVSWLVSSSSGDGRSSDSLGALAGSSSDSVVDLDVSADVSGAQVAACSPDAAKVLYAEVQKTAAGDQPVLVVREKSGDLRLCDSFGGDAPSVAPVRYADGGHPVTLLSNGRQAWDCDGTRLAGFAISHWLSVDSAVRRVELRFLIDGATGPWFSARAQGGLVHVHGWLSQQNDGAAVQVQLRVIGAAGHPVPQSAVPTKPQHVRGCAKGGIQLG
jgi:hypothetical protein